MSDPFRFTLQLRQTHDSDPQMRAPLEATQQAMGMVPNMYRAMANLPSLLETYQFGYQRLREESGFSAIEQEVLFLSISRENECHYCMAAHSFAADKMSKVPAEVTDAIREDRPISDPKLEALCSFARSMVSSRGNPTAQEARAFLDAGFSETQILSIVLAIGVKIFSNYTNHLFATQVDSQFAAHAWTAGEGGGGS